MVDERPVDGEPVEPGGERPERALRAALELVTIL
jgi:hypothetical protein